MFDMGKIGVTISRYRKAGNMTQMELADRLGISFQAVSNWERGLSMPDIAKLTELSAIFGVSIDTLLDNKRAAEILGSINANVSLPPVNREDLDDLAPILKPKQVDKLFTSADDADCADITSVAPFLSQSFLDDWAMKRFERTGDLAAISPIAAFVSDQVIDTLAGQALANGGGLESIACILPFVSESIVTEFASKKFAATKDIHVLTAGAPFIGQSFLDACAIETLERTGNLADIACLAPFISDAVLNKLAADALEKNGLHAISAIMPFIDAKIVEDYIRMKSASTE